MVCLLVCGYTEWTPPVVLLPPTEGVNIDVIKVATCPDIQIHIVVLLINLIDCDLGGSVDGEQVGVVLFQM